MKPINMSHARSSLSRLVWAIEQGIESEIVISRNGRPVAKLVSFDAAPVKRRLGIAKGKFEVPDNLDNHNDELARLFMNDQAS